MASDSETEDLELQFEEKIMEMECEALEKLAEGLSIESGQWQGKKKTTLLRILRKYMNQKVEEASDGNTEDRKNFLINLLTAVNVSSTQMIEDTTAVGKGIVGAPPHSEEDIKKMTEDLYARRDALLKVLVDREDKDELVDSFKGTNVSDEAIRQQMLQAFGGHPKTAEHLTFRKLSLLEDKIDSLEMKEKKAFNLSPWKKDFAIIGKIGEPMNDKDIGYLGTMRQAKEGLDKGYSESEIVAGILRAIGPKSLKTYLGTKTDLNVIDLSKYLRIHYHEKSATELYQELINMKQNAKEESVAFVVRAFETREKILIASREGGREVYDERQVRQLCLSTIESGINGDIALIIRPFLKCGSRLISDVELMDEVYRAEASLQMRQQKNASKKNVTFSVITHDSNQGAHSSQGATCDSQILKAIQSLESKMSSVEDLKKEIKDLKAEVQTMKMQNTNRSERNVNDTRKFVPRKCLKCHTDKVESCQHCYKCGSKEHYAKGCRNSLNRKGLSTAGNR